jgi:hypothetical protein
MKMTIKNKIGWFIVTMIAFAWTFNTYTDVKTAAGKHASMGLHADRSYNEDKVTKFNPETRKSEYTGDYIVKDPEDVCDSFATPRHWSGFSGFMTIAFAFGSGILAVIGLGSLLADVPKKTRLPKAVAKDKEGNTMVDKCA